MNDKDKIKKVESYRWVVWTILALLYVFVTFHRMGTGVVRNELEEDFSIGAAQFANIGSMYFYAYFIMQIPSGILADKFGPKITVTIFSLLAAAGSVIFGLAPVINVAYIGRFLVGIGVSVVFICLIKLFNKDSIPLVLFKKFWINDWFCRTGSKCWGSIGTNPASLCCQPVWLEKNICLHGIRHGNFLGFNCPICKKRSKGYGTAKYG